MNVTVSYCGKHQVFGVCQQCEREDAESKALKEAALKLLSAKGRYHTQIAMCELSELLGLPAVWPDNHPKAKGGQQ